MRCERRGRELVALPRRAILDAPLVGRLRGDEARFANAIVVAQRAREWDEEIAHVIGYAVRESAILGHMPVIGQTVSVT